LAPICGTQATRAKNNNLAYKPTNYSTVLFLNMAVLFVSPWPC